MEIMKEAGVDLMGGVGPEEMGLINGLARRELKAEEVYTFTVRLCDNEVDREWERFPRATLEELAGLFVGKSGIFDHNWSAAGQAARIYKAEVVEEPGKVTAAGEPGCYLKGWAYMLRTKANAELIAQIEGGIKKEVSVGCSVEREVCSVCGEAVGSCRHVKGRTYNGKLCYGELTGAKDAYEWSFVAVPAQRRAGVIKSAGVRLEDEARLGRKYLKGLRSELVRLAGIAEPELGHGLLEKVAGKLDEEELAGLIKLYRGKADRLLAGGPQLSYGPERTAEEGSDGAFLI